MDGLAACNGHLVILADRGLWLDNEHPQPSGKAHDRLSRIRFPNFPDIPDDSWHPLSAFTHDLYRARTIIHPWTGSNTLSPSPLWMIAEKFPIRLSLLQLIGRLPKAEVSTHNAHHSMPLPFRCSGARGLVAPILGFTMGHSPIAKRILSPKVDPFAPR